MQNERRFFRFIDSGDNYDLDDLICQFEADSDSEAHAEFLRRTGCSVDECPRVQGMSFNLNGKAHRELLGLPAIEPVVAPAVYQG